MKKPSMLLVNKMDTEEAIEKFENVSEKLRNLSGNSNSYNACILFLCNAFLHFLFL